MRRTILFCLLWLLVGIACAAPREEGRARMAPVAPAAVKLVETPRLRVYEIGRAHV